ncbi:unnamed protein product, partial [Closterium sp. NIES-53]
MEGWRCVGVPCLELSCLCLQYFPLTRVAGSFTTPPRAVSSPLKTSCLTNPLPGTVPVEVTLDLCASRGAASEGAASGGAASRGAEPASAEPGGAEPGGAESEGAESGGAEPGGAELGGIEHEGAEPRSAESEGAESRGAEPRGTASAGPPAGASQRLSPWREPLSPPQLRESFSQRTRLRTRAGGTGGAGATGPGGACTRGTGAAGAGGVGGAGAGDTGAGGAGAGGAGDPDVGGAGARGAGPVDPVAGDPRAGGAGAGGAGAGRTGAGGFVQWRQFSVSPPPSSLPPPDSVLRQVLSLPSSTGLPPSLLSPPPHLSLPHLQPSSPLPAPSPSAKKTDSLTERCEPESRPASPVRTGCRVPRPLPPPVPGTHIMALRPSSVPLRVPLPSPPASTLADGPDPESDLVRAASPTVPRLLATVVTDLSFESTAASALVAEHVDFAATCRLDYATSLVPESNSDCPPSVGGEWALGTDVLEDRQEDLECLEAAVPHLMAMLLAPEGDPDAPDILTPCSYAKAITVPPSGANIVDGMWIFRVKRPPSSTPVFKARYVARGLCQRQGVDFFQTFSPNSKMTTLRVLMHIAAQRDYELHSLDFSTAFLQGSLHEEIWLRRPSGFTGSFPAAIGFAPSTADPSLFLRTDTSLPPFHVIVYVNDSVFATADTETLALVLQRFGFQYSSPQSTPLPTGHSLSAPPSDESVEPSGPYPELVGCLMCLMTCTRPDFAYPLSILARYVAPGRHRPEHWEAAKRVLHYLCSTSGMGLMLGGRGPVVLTGHADASWVDDLATRRLSQCYTFSLGSGSVSWQSTHSSSVLGSSCEADIYVGAMAAQELRWLTYLLTDLGERPRSSQVLSVVSFVLLTWPLGPILLIYSPRHFSLFDTWLDDLQLYLLSDSKDSVLLLDLASGAATAPPATADSVTRSHWLTHDAAAPLAIRNHLPLAKCAHFGHHMTAQALYDAVVARYSSPATAALGRMLLPYLFPELSAFATVEDLVSHLRTSDAPYCATVPVEFLDKNQPPMFITLYFIVTRLPDSLRLAVAVGAARDTPRTPFFEGCPPSPLAPSYASAAAADVPGAKDVKAASASAKRRSGKGKGGRGGGSGSGVGGGGSSGGGGSGGSGGGSGGSGGGGGSSGWSSGSGSGGTGGG